MPEYRQVPVAGNFAGTNAFRCKFTVADHSDIPQITAWDDEQLNTTTAECLVGTAANGAKSFLAAKSTSDGHAAAGAGWATALAQTPGAAEANRLKGALAFIPLGTTAPVGPFPKFRTFQFAFGCAADSSPGSVGYQPAIAAKVFYTGAPPTVDFEYNDGSDGVPNWVTMTSQNKGTGLPLGVKTAIHATGPDTVGGTSDDGALDPITKPGSGEKFAEEYWVRTL